MAGSFDLGGEVAADGRFVRQESVFRRWVTRRRQLRVPGRSRAATTCTSAWPARGRTAR